MAEPTAGSPAADPADLWGDPSAAVVVADLADRGDPVDPALVVAEAAVVVVAEEEVVVEAEVGEEEAVAAGEAAVVVDQPIRP